LTPERRAAVVTGGASGIGLEIVRHLSSEGMGVVAVDWSAQACEEAVRSLGRLAERVLVVQADVGTPEGAHIGVTGAVERFGRLDLLCNNAALHPHEHIEEHALESWRETFRVNVDGTMLCSQAALAEMKRHHSGSIVNIGSISGIAPYAGGGAYAASKAAIAMLTKVLAIEAGPYGVRVNCISPGAIRHRAVAAGDESAPAQIPLGRRGTPADVAHLVSYLASEQAGYLTGSVIVLDGGATAGRPRSR
jgi:NAD(P)-dependent dehydrogenase (short-subunit alcohol dehydrogenase family)